jgi:type IX secretion system substrate protein
MKPLYPTTVFSAILTIALFSANLTAHSQASSTPVLSFRNSVLISGNANQDGAVYKFPNVTTGVDALVTIAGRNSSDGNTSNVVLTTIDETGTGYDSAFQPQINYVNGSKIKSNVVTDWYIEFNIAFVKAGTTTPTTVSAFDVSGIDVDGNSSLHEYVSFYNLNTYTLENQTSLTTTSVTSSIVDLVNGVINFISGLVSTVTEPGKRFDGGNVEYDGIDVTATKAMVTSHYINTSNFSVRIGGKATGPINISSGGRENSLYFKSFSYTNPIIGTLPIELESFNAQLNNSSAVGLKWVTSSEMNANNFVVERSTNGTDFTDQALVFTKEGNSIADRDYAFTDNISSINSNIIYYRLKMVDNNGEFKYSNIALIRLQEENQISLVTFPNPAVNQLNITIPTEWQNKTIAYSMYNLNGNLVNQKINNSAGQTETFNISNLPAGLYLVEVNNGNTKSIQRFIKAK